MRAADYINKYGEPFSKLTSDEERKKMIFEIADAFYQELRELMEVRHITTERGLYHAVNELNAKWNALARLFEKYYHVSPMKRDGFRIMIDELVKEGANGGKEKALQ